jgi:hypothetical protein
MRHTIENYQSDRSAITKVSPLSICIFLLWMLFSKGCVHSNSVSSPPSLCHFICSISRFRIDFDFLFVLGRRYDVWCGESRVFLSGRVHLTLYTVVVAVADRMLGGSRPLFSLISSNWANWREGEVWFMYYSTPIIYCCFFPFSWRLNRHKTHNSHWLDLPFVELLRHEQMECVVVVFVSPRTKFFDCCN